MSGAAKTSGKKKSGPADTGSAAPAPATAGAAGPGHAPVPAAAGQTDPARPVLTCEMFSAHTAEDDAAKESFGKVEEAWKAADAL